MFAGVVGLVARLPLPRLAALFLRAAASAMASRLFLPPDLRAQVEWLWPALAMAMFLTWTTLESLSQFDPGPGLPLGIAVAFWAAAGVILHAHSAPDGGDTAAPTTILVDGSGTVRWTFRPDRVLNRLSPSQVLAAVDNKMPAD